jgi:hypothetical protein
VRGPFVPPVQNLATSSCNSTLPFLVGHRELYCTILNSIVSPIIY